MIQLVECLVLSQIVGGSSPPTASYYICINMKKIKETKEQRKERIRLASCLKTQVINNKKRQNKRLTNYDLRSNVDHDK